MNPKTAIKKVKESTEFKTFMKEDSKAYLCSLFFTEDLNENKKEVQVDFYSPKKAMIISFKVDKKVERAPLGKKAETITHKKFVPKKLDENLKMDFEELAPALIDEMHNRGMTYQVEKVMAFVNVTDDEIIWNCTAFLRGLGLLIAHVEDKSKTVLYMDKKSFLDIFRFAGGTGQGLQQQNTQANITKVDVNKEIKENKKDKK